MVEASGTLACERFKNFPVAAASLWSLSSGTANEDEWAVSVAKFVISDFTSSKAMGYFTIKKDFQKVIL